MKMADALVGATIKITLEKVVSFATDQIGTVWGFKKDLERLKGTVGMILAVVDDAEEKQVQDRAVNLWLQKLEELACRADHVLDEINYEMLRRRVEDQHQLKGKVSFFSSRNTTVFRWRMARKFKHINSEFELIKEEASSFGLQSRAGASVANTTLLLAKPGSSRETDSIVRQKVIGRENDASKIVEKLLSPSNQILSFIPITGMAGLGKTTLAQLVYNHHKLGDQFGKKIWVCVSEDFEPKRIFKLMLESLTKTPVASFEGRDTIVQQIKEKLEGKSYLLVLDDVWNEKSQLWDDFLGSLAGISSSSGNWIIVTTRKLQVVLNLPTGLAFSLEKLSDEDCLHIVKENALLQGERIQDFEAIREKIKELCQGLPLAASVIGGLLRTNPRAQWPSVLQKGISNMSGDEHSNLMRILKLSFDHLPSPSLKKCFAYCSFFKKDSLMEKKQLIELWMAEGFLQLSSGNEMEIGNQYINSLLQSSLLQEVIDEDAESRCVRMHDLVHDLAELISKPKNGVRDVKTRAHSLVVDSFGEETKTLTGMLRTLFSGNGKYDDMLMSFNHLHALILSQIIKELPSSIDKLIHLRYFDLSCSEIKALPESLCKLYNLQTLRINGCHNLEELPKGMTNLISLRHLHCDPHHGMPPEMGRLTSLQTLEYFHVSPENQIKELGYLENLRGELAIYNLERVSSKEEALQASLYRKPLNMLELYWSGGGESAEGVLDGLQPHPSLQKLRIKQFSGAQFPSWFRNMKVCMDQNLVYHGSTKGLNKLVSLTMIDCQRCKELPSLGQLPSLKYLQLSGLDNIICIEPSFYGIDARSGSGNNSGYGEQDQMPEKIFPALRRLQLKQMRNLQEWMEPETANGEAIEIFPNLEDLIIDDCRQLRNVPIHHFQSLKHLHISGTNLDNIFPTVETDQDCNRSPNPTPFLESLKIESCAKLSELPEYLYEFQFLHDLEMRYCLGLTSLPIPSGQQRLSSLKKLVICGCRGLHSLPRQLLQSCVSLQYLKISDCKNLISIPDDLLNSCVSLRSLSISDCGELKSIPDGLLNSCVFLRSLSISGCKELTSIPAGLLSSSCASLCSLSIRGCHSLTSIPAIRSCKSLQSLDLYRLYKLDLFQLDLQQMPSLTSLVLCRVPISVPAPMLQPSSHYNRLSTVIIGGFPGSVEFDWSALSSSSSSLCKLELRSWPDLLCLPEQLQHLTALRELQLSELGRIESLPDWFAKLVSLEELSLGDCGKLRHLPSMAAMRRLTKLSWLTINDCPRLTGPKLSDPEWAKISRIPNVMIESTVIKSGKVLRR